MRLSNLRYFSLRILSADDIAQRRELLRQKQLEKPITNDSSTEATIENTIEDKNNPGNSTTKAEVDDAMDKNVFLAFARIYSGTIRAGQKIFVLSPRHDPKLFVDKVRLNHFCFYSNQSIACSCFCRISVKYYPALSLTIFVNS